MVDDDREDYLITKGLYIDAGRDPSLFEWVDNAADAHEQIRTNNYDVVLLDYRLGGGERNGFEILREAIADGIHSSFIFLTGNQDLDFATRVIRAGAADYLVKGQITAPLMDRALRYAVERGRLDRARTESENRFRFVANATPALLYMIDQDGKGTFFNDSWLIFRGAPLDQELGTGWQEGIHPDDRQMVMAGKMKALHRLDPYNGEYRLLRTDGQYRWVVDASLPLIVSNGSCEGYVGSLTDFTERREYEQQLAAARDQALEGSRMKSVFLANMSHEIRTPMNGIIGMAGLLTETTIDEDQRGMLRTIMTCGDSLLDLINDILDFSKIEAGRLHLVDSEFDFADVVRGVAQMMSPRVREKDIDLVVEIDPALEGRYLGDAGRLRQVLINLAGNAVKFTDHGHVSIRARQTDADESRAMVRVEIEDTGVGIPESAQSRLFQPFVQADGSSTRRFGGTGLGLAICSQLIDMLGGRIGFDTEVDKGSTFWIEVSFERSTRPRGARPGQLPKDMRVLVVDDSETNRRILIGQLAQLGIFPTTSSNADEALAHLRSHAQGAEPYDVVLLDWHMPDIDGIQLATEIRADGLLVGTPLVVLSSAGWHLDPDQLDAIRFEAILNKPVNMVDLRDVLVQCAELRVAAGHREDLGEEPARQPLNLLVVEDHPANRVVLTRQLEKIGHRVTLAHNGVQALELLAREPFDAVFMDCQMPVMDGYETTRRIRAGKVSPDVAKIPIIAITAHALPHDRARCLEAGMNDYVSKPAQMQDLEEAIARCGLLDAPAPAAP